MEKPQWTKRHVQGSSLVYFKMNLRSVHLLLIATALTVAAQEEDDSYCYSDDDEPYIQFGTKTSYELTHGNLADVEIEPGKRFSYNDIYILNRRIFQVANRSWCGH